MRQRSRSIRGIRIARRVSSAGPGFLTLERLIIRNIYGDGRTSAPYRVEVVHRRGVDAVAIFPFFFTARPGRLMVVTKIGFRPGLFRRRSLRLPVRDRREYRHVREAVAGSLEPQDRGAAGVDARARAEMLEETGFRPLHRRPIRLGAGFFPSHGQSTEKIHLRAFEIDPSSHIIPPTDGSINEIDSGTVILEAGRILEMCRSGAIEDPKIEIGVNRLCRHLAYRPVR